MRRLPSIILLAAALVSTPALARDGARAFDKVPVADDALSSMRGGFALPGGVDVSVAVQSDTLVNGVLLLRSVYVIDKGAPTLTVFGRTDPIPEQAPVPGKNVSTSSLTVSTQRTTSDGAPSGLTQLNLTPDGSAAAASGGTVRVERAGMGSQVVLSQPTLDIRHLTGQALGAVVLNRGNDVSIDTVSNINVDLKDATPFNIGSAIFRVDAAAIDSAARMGR